MKRIITYIKNLFKQKKAVVFTLSIAFSCILWVLIKFSDTYEGVISFNIDYVNIPKDKVLLGNPPTNLKTSVRMQGFEILNYRLFVRNMALDASKMNKKGNKSYFSHSYLEAAIKKQLKKNSSLHQLKKDTLFLNFGINIKRVIPIISQLSLDFQKDFELYDSIAIIPASLTVWGPEDTVDSLTAIKTKKVVLNDIQENIDISALLIIPEALKNLDFSTKKVQIKARVERFSERLIKVPIRIINVPPEVVIRIFPREVEVLCKASIEDIKNINAEDFTIVCDFNKGNASSNYLIPEVLHKPVAIKEISLQEKKVEYLINRE